MSQQINLFNPLLLEPKRYFSALTMVQALGILFAALMVVYGALAYQVRKVERRATDSEQQFKLERERLLALTKQLSPEGRSKVLADQLAQAEREVDQRGRLLQSIRVGDLGNTEGFSRFLAALARQSVPGVWITGMTLAAGGQELILRGRALHPDLLPQYLRALNREEVMRGRSVTELKIAAQETPPAAAPAKPPAAPARFVEFILKAPQRAAEPVPAKPGAQKGGS
jgi:hypothetical protein